MTEERTFRCANGHLLDEATGNAIPRVPCPECGSVGRTVAVALTARVTPLARIARLRTGMQGRGKPVVDVTDDWKKEWRTGKLKALLRRIDRSADTYEESVVDLESGVEQHHSAEPLSDHRGHGSAKPKPPPDQPT